MVNTKLEKIYSESLLKSIFILSLPVIISNLAGVIYFVTDTYFIGQLNDVSQLAAATYASPYMLMMFAIGSMFGIGASSYISRSLGASDFESARHALGKALFFGMLTSLVVVFISVSLNAQIATVMGASGDSLGHTINYLTIVSFAAPSIILNSVGMNTIRAEGSAKLAMVGMLLGVVVNIILDPIFIFTLDMGIKGAAWATALGNLSGSILCILAYLFVTKIKPSFTNLFEKDGIMKDILIVGIPSGLNIVIVSIAMMVMNSLLSSYGDTIVSGNGLAIRTNDIVLQIMLGISLGILPLIGYCYGKKDYIRMKQIIKKSHQLNFLLGCILSIIGIIFADKLIGIYTDDEMVIEYGSYALKVLFFTKPILGYLFVSNSSLQAMGKGGIVLVTMVSRHLLITIPMMFILNITVGKKGVIWAYGISDFIFMFIITYVLYKITHKLIESQSKKCGLLEGLVEDTQNII